VIIAKHELGANSRSQYFAGWSSFFGAVMGFPSLLLRDVKALLRWNQRDKSREAVAASWYG
jgi:hypothetical protein